MACRNVGTLLRRGRGPRAQWHRHGPLPGGREPEGAVPVRVRLVAGSGAVEAAEPVAGRGAGGAQSAAAYRLWLGEHRQGDWGRTRGIGALQGAGAGAAGAVGRDGGVAWAVAARRTGQALCGELLVVVSDRFSGSLMHLSDGGDGWWCGGRDDPLWCPARNPWRCRCVAAGAYDLACLWSAVDEGDAGPAARYPGEGGLRRGGSGAG